MKFDKKHRPQTLNDVIFADVDVKQTLNEYANNQRDKHLLLYGPKGTGKSVSAQLVLKERMGVNWQAGLGDPWNAAAYQAKYDSFEPALKQWNLQHSMGSDMGCSVFDELDQFTLPMQHKLRAFIDQCEIGTIIATTNNLHLIDGPLKDRFRPLFVEYPSVEQWVPRVVSVMEAESIPITAAQAAGLLKGFEGSGRKLDDWMEDLVFRLKRFMTQVTTPPDAAMCANHQRERQMSEQLEFELIYLLDLVDEELISVLEKMNAWDDLQVCAAIFDLDITAVTDPSDIFDELILQKADQHLPEAKANAFKRIWEKVNADLRIPLAVKILLAD